MHKNGIKILNLMFRPNESICVSDNKYAFHSIPLKNIFNKTITLTSPNNNIMNRTISTDTIRLVALNPISGIRNDENCTAYRNFLVEIDNFHPKEQIKYINKLKLPYSASIFSGNKSIHFLISLSKDIPNELEWRLLAEWTLKIVNAADQNTKNPSRSIRIPGPTRNDKKQMLIKYNGPVKNKDFIDWLKSNKSSYPGRKKIVHYDGNIDSSKIKKWVLDKLLYGVDTTKGRNSQWYAIAYEFALSGLPEDRTIKYLRKSFIPERDFKEKEWLSTIKSAYKHALG